MLTTLLAARLMTQLEVTNIEAGSEVRYPVVLVRGNAGPDKRVIIGRDWKHMISFPVIDHKYVGLVELKPGANMVLLQSGPDTVKLRLDYRPMTSPYKVAAIYLASQDESTEYEAPPGVNRTLYGERLDTSLKLLQCFTAEAMNAAGYGRKTFRLEFDAKGTVVTHVVRAPKTGAELRAMDGNALWSYFYDQLKDPYPYDVNRCCAVMSFTKYDPVAKKALAHTALGGGGLGLFGGASLWSWPESLAQVPSVFSDASPVDTGTTLDDSGLRGTKWALSATTLGAMLHELGHTFGLPHSADPECVMSRGFDHINRAFTLVEPPCARHAEPLVCTPDNTSRWDPFFAARLNWNPWFQPDGKHGKTFATDLGPRIELDPKTDTVTIRAPRGIAVSGAEAEGKVPAFEVKQDHPTSLQLNLKDLRAKIGVNQFDIYVLDVEGIEARLTIKP